MGSSTVTEIAECFMTYTKKEKKPIFSKELIAKLLEVKSELYCDLYYVFALSKKNPNKHKRFYEIVWQRIARLHTIAGYVMAYMKKQGLLDGLPEEEEKQKFFSIESIAVLLAEKSDLYDQFVPPTEWYHKFATYYANDITLKSYVEYDKYDTKFHEQNTKHKLFCCEVWSAILKEYFKKFFPPPTPIIRDMLSQTRYMKAPKFYSSLK